MTSCVSPFLSYLAPTPLMMRGKGAPRETTMAVPVNDPWSRVLGGILINTKTRGPVPNHLSTARPLPNSDRGLLGPNATPIPTYGQVLFNGPFYGSSGPRLS